MNRTKKRIGGVFGWIIVLLLVAGIVAGGVWIWISYSPTRTDSESLTPDVSNDQAVSLFVRNAMRRLLEVDAGNFRESSTSPKFFLGGEEMPLSPFLFSSKFEGTKLEADDRFGILPGFRAEASSFPEGKKDEKFEIEFNGKRIASPQIPTYFGGRVLYQPTIGASPSILSLEWRNEKGSDKKSWMEFFVSLGLRTYSEGDGGVSMFSTGGGITAFALFGDDRSFVEMTFVFPSLNGITSVLSNIENEMKTLLGNEIKYGPFIFRSSGTIPQPAIAGISNQGILSVYSMSATTEDPGFHVIRTITRTLTAFRIPVSHSIVMSLEEWTGNGSRVLGEWMGTESPLVLGQKLSDKKHPDISLESYPMGDGFVLAVLTDEHAAKIAIEMEKSLGLLDPTPLRNILVRTSE